MKALVLAGAFFLGLMGSGFAQAQLDPQQKERAEALYGELRCVVCQNQSILDSDADVAKDLREIVSEQITAGRTDSEIKTFLVDRYGEFVLLRPVFSAHTLILWIAPLLFLILGLFLVWRSISSQPRSVVRVELSEAEEKRLNELLDEHENK